ncbi:hypothetical protein Hanom_Chr00s000004g01609031 [Helianthus anomalus]
MPYLLCRFHHVFVLDAAESSQVPASYAKEVFIICCKKLTLPKEQICKPVFSYL